MPPWITAIVYAIALHAASGAAFATLFVTIWISKLDPAARGGSWAVRALLWPGCVAMWPVLWRRLATARDVSE